MILANFQVDERVKSGLPYMTEKHGQTMMIAYLVTPHMSWDEQQAKGALVPAARTL